MAVTIPVVTWGNVQLGTQLLYGLPLAQRITDPVEQSGLLAASAQLFDAGTNLVWRLRTIIYEDQSDQLAFALQMIKYARLMRAGRQDLAWYWPEGTITWPKTFFTGFDRPQPNSPLEARFSDGVVFMHSTEFDPVT